MNKKYLLGMWIMILVLFPLKSFTQTITISKVVKPGISDHYEDHDDKKHKYFLRCYETHDRPCSWSFPPEKIKGYHSDEIEDWVKKEILKGKTEGDTMYQNVVYVRWNILENTTNIKMSNKPIKQ